MAVLIVEHPHIMSIKIHAYRVTDEVFLADTSKYGPPTFFKERNFVFLYTDSVAMKKGQ